MSLESRLEDLRRDLVREDGPSISTNRNYPFALFHYPPEEEFKARDKVGDLADSLRIQGWNIRTVDLFGVLLDALAKEEEGELLPAWVEEEKLLYRSGKGDFSQPMRFLQNHLGPFFQKGTGYPARVVEEIRKAAHGADPRRTVVFLSRIGALYPFYRTSALLRHLDQGVNVPTIVLYPGTLVDDHTLSFMGELAADRDYRPRIY